jgi:hypothetical protein
MKLKEVPSLASPKDSTASAERGLPEFSGYIPVYVPAERLEEVHALLGSRPLLWNEKRLREMYEGVPQHTRAFFDVLAAKGGQWVSIDEMANALGVEKSRVRGILSGFTRRLGTLFNGEKRWPMDYRVIDGRAHWMLPTPYAEVLSGVKHRPGPS